MNQLRMPYRFKASSDPRKDVRRLFNEQIGRATAHLSGSEESGDTAIHATRKAMKRCRSILRLIRPALDEKIFRRHDHQFRDIARILSEHRNSEVLRETLHHLEQRSETADARNALAEALREVEAKPINGFPIVGGASQSVDLALSRLKDAEQAVSGLDIKNLRYRDLAEGFADIYAGGRKALKTAYRVQNAETFHEFRKVLQHHWRHCQLLAPLWPELMNVRISAARELSQLVGIDHDLSLIEARYELASEVTALRGELRSLICAEARAEQQRLRADVKPLASRLYALPRSDIQRLVEHLWPVATKLARHRKKALAAAPVTDLSSKTH